MVSISVTSIFVAATCYIIGHTVCNTFLDPSMNFFAGMLSGMVSSGILEMIDSITNAEK